MGTLLWNFLVTESLACPYEHVIYNVFVCEHVILHFSLEIR